MKFKDLSPEQQAVVKKTAHKRLVSIDMIRGFRSNKPGDRCGFRADLALALIKAGRAELNPYGEWTLDQLRKERESKGPDEGEVGRLRALEVPMSDKAVSAFQAVRKGL